MNTKASLLATAAGLAMFNSASAQVVIDITGSTAGRSAVHNRILALLPDEVFSWSGNAVVTSANRAIYKGTYDGKAVVIRTFWSGSAAGVRDVADAPQLAASFIDKATVPNGAVIASPVLAPASAESVAEIGFSDVFQSSTIYTANTLVDEASVAVLPFLFMKNDGAPAALTNITSTQFRAVYTGLGVAPLSLFTGVAAQSTTNVYGSGRNNESGTRITVQAETGTGVFATLAQYQGTGDPSTVNFVGNSGYSSGNDVATLLGATQPANRALIAYIGVSDGNTAAGLGASYLTFNGVSYTEDAVRNGSYSLWGYLHQFSMDISGATRGDGGTTQLFYDSLKSSLIGNPGSGTIGINTMNVERSADGSTVTPL